MEAVRKVNEIGRHFIADFKLPKSAHSKDEAKEKDANENELRKFVAAVLAVSSPKVPQTH